MTVADRRRDLDSVDYDLHSLDAEVRRLAVERMSELPESDALPRLADALGDPGWRVRKAAVDRILALDREEDADRVLIEALTDEAPKILRNAALEGLVRRGAAAVPRLAEAVRSADPGRRQRLIQAMAGIGDESAEAPVRGLLDDGDPQVAAAAAAALGVFGGAASAADLMAAAMCEHADGLLRGSALRSLARLEVGVDPMALEPLLDDPALCPAALAAIATSDDPVATELLLKRVVPGPSATVGAAVAGLVEVVSRRDFAEAEWLVHRIREVVAAQPGLLACLAERLEDPDHSVRWASLQFLGLVGDPRAGLSVLEACCDEAIAPLARTTLNSFGPPVESVLDAAWEDLDSVLRMEVCRVLGTTGGATGAGRLQRALEDPDLTVRIAAIEALAAHADPAAVAPLAGRLQWVSRESEEDARDERVAIVDALIDVASGDGTPAVAQTCTAAVVDALMDGFEEAPDPARVAMARVLGRIGRPCDESFVVRLLRDPSAHVRRAAIIALSRLRHGSGAERLRFALLDEDVGVRCAAATALGETNGEGVLEDLVRLYREDDHVRVRAAVLRAAASHAQHEPAGRTPVLRFVKEAELGEPIIAIAAADALSRLGGAAAVEVALRLLGRSEPEVVQAAVECVARHGEASHLEQLLALVSHPEWSVRCEAIRAFALRGFARAAPLILGRLETERDPFVRDAILQTLARLDG